MFLFNNTEVYFYILEGAPCSGKTTIYETLKNMLGDGETDVAYGFIPEAATYLLKQENCSQIDRTVFQERISLVYYQCFERQIKTHSGRVKKLVLLLDRCPCNSMIYEHNSKILIHNEKMLFDYDGVFFLEALPLGTIKAGNDYRLESNWRELEDLAERSYRFFSKHQNFIYLPATMHIEERANLIITHIKEFINQHTSI